MKKTLLLGTALVVGVVGFAQNAKPRVLTSMKAHSKFGAKKSTNEHSSTGVLTPAQAGKGTSHNATDATCGVSHLSSSYTSAGFFDWLSNGNSTYRNVLTYNSDLNTIAFIHRNSGDWKLDNGNTVVPTGCIQANWWQVGNMAAQDSMMIYHTLSTTNFHSARYPTGTLFNPPGNTSISNAFMCATGVYTPDGTNFNAGCYYAARQPKGTYHALPTLDNQKTCATGTAPFGNIGGYVFSNAIYSGTLMNDMQQAGNKAVSSGSLLDVNVTVTAGGNNLKGMLIAKAVYSAAGDSLVWTADSIIPGYHIDPVTQGDGTQGQGYSADLRPRVAFGPNGQIGYAVMLGNLQTVYGTSADSMIAPIVYKTTDGGTTWNPVLLGYDWNTGHPEVLRGVGLHGAPYTDGTAPFNFQFNDNPDGSDLTVDANGVLHYVTTVQEVVDDGMYKDTLEAAYDATAHYDYFHHYPMIWDFMTDGNCWKTLLVDSINTEYVGGQTTDTSNAYSRWAVIATAGSNEGMGAHLTVSRSTDGNVIFYGWGESDPTGTHSTVTGLIYNIDPDLMMKAYDINSSKISVKKDITNGDEDVFQPYLSDISYFDGAQSAWVVPAVYVTKGRVQAATPGPGGIIYDINSALDYRYIDCGTFTAGEINITANVFQDQISSACAAGIKTNNAFASSINNFPNPFSTNTTIAVTLSESKAFDVKVYNTIGTLVFSKKVNGNVGENDVTFDAGALSSGVYYYTVSAGSEQATKKMVIQK